MAKYEFGDVDTTQVRALANDLKTVRSRLKPELARATLLSARHIRDEARRSFRSQTTGTHTGKYPATITHEILTSNATTVTAEIGPEKGGIGSLGHIFEFGSSRSGPMPHLVPAWLAEDSKYVTALANAGERAMLP